MTATKIASAPVVFQKFLVSGGDEFEAKCPSPPVAALVVRRRLQQRNVSRVQAGRLRVEASDSMERPQDKG